MDAEIAAAIERGHYRFALELTCRAHGAQLVRLCQAMIGEAGEAEELAQEVLIQAFRAMPGFGGRAQVRTWLWTIARRTCGAALRKRARRHRLGAPLFCMPARAPAEPDPEDQLEARRQLRHLRAALSDLPSRQQEVLLLRFCAGLTFAEAARVCGVREATARKRASVALGRLRERLAGAMSEEADLMHCQEA